MLLFLVNSISAQKNEIIIKGKIIGDVSEKIEYTTPINGTWFYGSKQSITPNSLGEFQITMNVESPSFVTIYIPKKANGTLLVESGKTYNINFNLTSKDKKFIAKGKNSKAQNIYNTFPNPDFNIYDIRDYKNDSIASVIISKIKKVKEEEVSQFKELFNKNEISEGFLTLVKLDRECFYTALQGRVASYKFMESKRNNSKKLKNVSINLWSETFKDSPLTTSLFFRSPWFYTFADNFTEYNLFKNNSFDFEKLSKTYYHSGLRHSKIIEMSKIFLTENILEYFYASYIYFHGWQNEDNSKELIKLYDDFKKEFPNSKYSEYLTTIITPIIKYHNKVDEETRSKDKFKFIDNFEKINSFKELTKTLKGKKIYIDIWTTWCGPCKKEFKHKTKLKTLLESKNTEILYISHDKDERNELWKEMIKGYDLEGYHIRANELLKADIIKIFGNNGSFYYPRYILIDEKGTVVNEYVAKPSESIKLEKQLNNLY